MSKGVKRFVRRLGKGRMLGGAGGGVGEVVEGVMFGGFRWVGVGNWVWVDEGVREVVGALVRSGEA